MDDVDSIVVVNKPDDAGVFNLKRACSENPFYFFLTSAIDRTNSVVPVEPPFVMQEGKTKDFPVLAGIKMTKQNADVGDIKIQTVYRRIKIDFLNESGEKLFPAFESAAEVHFSVSNEKGKLAGTGSLSKREAFEGSSVFMSLPEGKWIIEVGLKNGKGKTLHPDKSVEISRTENGLREITLKMSKRK
jgi:hypothetical protein